MAKTQSEILLINSPLGDQKFNLTEEDYVPPMGLGYVHSALKKNGIKCEFLDAVNKDMPTTEVEKYISDSPVNLVGINIFSTNKGEVLRIIKAFNNRVRFLVGGPGLRGLEKELLAVNANQGLDLVMGDGELITPDLVMKKELVQPKQTEKLNRLFVVDENSPYFIRDLDSIALDRTDFMNNGLSKNKGDVEACIVATRGCIYNCAFCGSAASRTGKIPSRIRSIKGIRSEISDLLNLSPNISSIRFVDDLFLRDKESILSAIEIFSQFPNLKWRAMAHINSFKNIPQDLLKQMKAAGCHEVFIGIESGSPKILRKIHKTSNLQTISDTVGQVLEAGINVKGYFIYGFPGETREDFQLTLDLASQLKIVSHQKQGNFRVSVFKFRPYEGTELFDSIAGAGNQIISDESLTKKLGQRAHFNFSSGNFSSCTKEEMDEFIEKTLNLNY